MKKVIQILLIVYSMSHFSAAEEGDGEEEEMKFIAARFPFPSVSDCKENEEFHVHGKRKACEVCSLDEKCEIKLAFFVCNCISGYKRHPETMDCIPEAECPDHQEEEAPKCGENEEYKDIATYPWCETCGTDDCGSVFTMNHCNCKEGYRRHPDTMECIPIKECPPLEEVETLICSDNEEARENGVLPACEACNPFLELDPCILRLAVKTCNCKVGYRRNDEGNCIPKDECPVYNAKDAIGCDENEEFHLSGITELCETCNINICPLALTPFACNCKRHFLRHPETKKCIPKSECPAKEE